MNNEPVAIRYNFDGYGYQYMDSGSGSDWQTRVNGEPLYTHPVKEHFEDEPQAEELYEIMQSNAELTDEEQTYKDLYIGTIKQLNNMLGIPEDDDMRFKWIAVELSEVLDELAILRKAPENG